MPLRTFCQSGMTRRKPPYSWIDRENRRGCFVVSAVLVLMIIALLYLGFHGDPIQNWAAEIPILG